MTEETKFVCEWCKEEIEVVTGNLTGDSDYKGVYHGTCYDAMVEMETKK